MIITGKQELIFDNILKEATASIVGTSSCWMREQGPTCDDNYKKPTRHFELFLKQFEQVL
jgi:hypothetical protein